MTFLSSGERNRALDGLRAVAVTLVLLRHLAPYRAPGGFCGVDVFFVLSGYLITSTLVGEFDVTGRIGFGAFYLRRCARLTPALGLLLAAAVVLHLVFPRGPFGWPAVAYAATYMMDWAGALRWTDSPILDHTWSLGVEEQFYLLWPPVLLVLLRWRRAAVPWAAAAIALLSAALALALHRAGADWRRTYYAFDTRAVALLVGCAAAFLPPDSPLARGLARVWPLPFLALAAVLVSVAIPDAILPLGGYAGLALVGAWIIVAVQAGAPPAVLLRAPAMVFVGRISYGVYLWQSLLIGVCGYLGLGRLAQAAVVIPATLALASASFFGLESPILEAARRRLASRSAGTRAAAPAVAQPAYPAAPTLSG
jgi:peptidoglycan/LPS O-acetylase OafA/YrhL